jgi:acyl-CoA thioesterase II
VGDLEEDTAVDGSAGRYRAMLSDDWEIWGPHGGYVAATALRAAGAETDRDTRPVTFSCQFLRTAKFAPVDITVVTMRRTPRAHALLVEITQGSERVLTAHTWAALAGDGMEHEDAPMPDVPTADEVPTIADRYADLPNDDPTPRPAPMFWSAVDCRILDFEAWSSTEPGDPVASGWFRFVPRSTFDDPWVDATRALIVLDTFTWGSASRAHGGAGPWIAPTLDLTTQFHNAAPGEPWLLARFHSAFAGRGAVAAEGRVWAPDGRLVASGTSSLLCTPRPVSP